MIRGVSEGAALTRAFIALDLDEASLVGMEHAVEGFRATASLGTRARWTSRDQMHATLKFLGRADDYVLEKMGDAVRALATGPPPLTRLWRIDGFPSLTHATVLVGALDDERGGLAALAQSFEEHALRLGVPREERAYRPHVTLARLGPPQSLVPWIERAGFTPFALSASATALYRSDQGPNGARYAALTRAFFDA